jgi:hypothetical protein
MYDPSALRAALVRFADKPGQCPACERVPYHGALGGVPPGWEEDANAAGYLRCCHACREARPNAWARRIDVERAAAWANEHHAGKAFALEDLRVLL